MWDIRTPWAFFVAGFALQALLILPFALGYARLLPGGQPGHGVRRVLLATAAIQIAIIAGAALANGMTRIMLPMTGGQLVVLVTVVLALRDLLAGRNISEG